MRKGIRRQGGSCQVQALLVRCLLPRFNRHTNLVPQRGGGGEEANGRLGASLDSGNDRNARQCHRKKVRVSMLSRHVDAFAVVGAGLLQVALLPGEVSQGAEGIPQAPDKAPCTCPYQCFVQGHGGPGQVSLRERASPEVGVRADQCDLGFASRRLKPQQEGNGLFSPAR